MKAQFPDWQKQQDAAAERGLISPALHQKFKWATTMLFHISHGQMHHQEGCFVYGGFGVYKCVSILCQEEKRLINEKGIMMDRNMVEWMRIFGKRKHKLFLKIVRDGKRLAPVIMSING